MNTKHTPGPWTVVRASKSTILKELYVRAGPDRVSRVVLPTARGIAECEANAHLISAAPEMLEALTLVRDALDQFALPYKYTLMAERAFGPQIRDAIKKATCG